MNPGIVDLIISRGLPLTVGIELCSDDLGTLPVDLTGCTIAAALTTDRETGTSVTLACSIADAEAGDIRIELDAAATASLPLLPHVWDMVVTDSSGGKTHTLTGPVTIEDIA